MELAAYYDDEGDERLHRPLSHAGWLLANASWRPLSPVDHIVFSKSVLVQVATRPGSSKRDIAL